MRGESLGWALVGAAAGGILLLAFPLRTRLARPVVTTSLAAFGALLAVGGAFIEGETGTAQAVLATLALALLTPLHVRVLFGSLGRSPEGRTG